MASVENTPADERPAGLNLEEGAEPLQLLFDTVPAMIWLKDTENNILRINRAAATAIGHAARDVQGRNSAELYPDEAAHYHADDLEVIRSGKPKLGIVEKVVLASGEKRWVKTDKLPYRDHSGKIRGVLVFAMDIHEQKMAEEALVHLTAELERSNQDLDRFASTASHDLLEPLRMVTCYLNLIGQRLPKTDTTLLEFIRFATDGATRMRLLVEGLLGYARLAARPVQLERVSCRNIVEEVLRDLRIRIDDSSARIVLGDLPELFAYGILLRQLFQNLLENALKYRRGEQAPEIEIRAKRSGGDWLFTVRDNGIGFTAADSDRIFLPFQRLAEKAHPEGLGLGLTNCRRIVERHGGRIWAEAEAGKGATFFFTLPLR